MKNKDINRIFIVDEIRGLAVFCMVVYHAFFIFSEMFNIGFAKEAFDFFEPIEPFFASLFIFICGLSCTFSSNNLKRGLILACVAIGFTISTCIIMPLIGFEELQIRFGILHLLGSCVLIYSLLSKRISINPYYGILICIVLYQLFSGINNGTLSFSNLIVLNIPDKLYETNWLMPLGIYSPTFFSGDYFPIFPHLFMFYIGVFCGKLFKAKGYSDFSKKRHSKFLEFLGRNSLIIYIVHMPLTYALAYLLTVIL